MEFIKLEEKEAYILFDSTAKYYRNIKNLLQALEKRQLPESMVHFINGEIDALNKFSATPKQVKKKLYKSYQSITAKVEKELKLVPEKYYATLWLSLGIASFGLPLGVIFSIFLDNMAFIGIGLAMGLAMGQGYGQILDQRAKNAGRQLEFKVH